MQLEVSYKAAKIIFPYPKMLLLAMGILSCNVNLRFFYIFNDDHIGCTFFDMDRHIINIFWENCYFYSLFLSMLYIVVVKLNLQWKGFVVSDITELKKQVT